MNDTDYHNLFETHAAAVEFEGQALSIGDDYLPECARTVRDGGDATPEYWAWLVGQAEEAQAS